MPATAFQDQGNIVDPQTLVFKRAVKDSKQAYDICKNLLYANQDRLGKQQLIAGKMNDAPPWDTRKLQAAGEGWRRNWSTGFMPTMVARVTPPYIQTISSARVLTASKLAGNTPDLDQKNEDFRVVTTKTIRKWEGFHGYITQVVTENIVYGYATSCYTDEWDWKPTFARCDDAIFPDGCPQDAKFVPIWMLRQRFLIHELAERLADPEISEAAGWNIKNLVKAINHAQPDQGGTKSQDDYRRFEDTIRETTVGTTYQAGTKQINAYHLFAQEANGKVSHYIVTEDTGDELFTRYDRFDSMDKCLNLFSIEVGNGKLHGSKGAGRRIYNTHVAIEQSRNLISDNLYLSGLILLKATQTGRQQAAITVQHPICVVGERYEVIDGKFNVDVEAFFALDRHLTSIAELQIGAFMPGQLLDSSGDKRTASEINYVAAIEQQIKEGYLKRFYGQSQRSIWEMQKRIYSPDNIIKGMEIFRQKQSGMKEMSEMAWEGMSKIMEFMGENPAEASVNVVSEISDAVAAVVELLEKGLTPQEIYELAQCPSWEAEFDLSSQNAAAIDMVVGRYKGDPSINQEELTKRDISAKLGASIAEKLMIPQEDNTVEAEATRMQILEMDSLLQGEQVPVSPRDIDLIHLGVIQEKTQNLLANMTPQSITKETLMSAQAILSHADQHVNSAISKGMKKEDLGPVLGFLEQAHKLLDGMPPPQDPALLAPPAGASFAGAPMTDRTMPAAAAAVAQGQDLNIAPQTLDASSGRIDVPLSRGPVNLQPDITTL